MASTTGTANVLVTIDGTGFDAGSVAYWNLQPRPTQFFSATRLQMTLFATDVRTAGTGAIQVITGAGTATQALMLEIIAPQSPAPSVSGITPSWVSPAGYSTATITGANFLPGALVSVGGTWVDHPAVGVGGTSISIYVPPSTSGDGPVDVRVLNPDGASATLPRTAEGALTYSSLPPSAPAITALSAATATSDGGPSITLNGSGFRTGAKVGFGTALQAATSVGGDGASLTVTVPAHAVGVVPVSITNRDGGTATLPAAFTYTAVPNHLPVWDAIVPASGPIAGNTTVQIQGSYLGGLQTLTFGGVAATNVSVSADGTVITATTPAHLAGAVDIVAVFGSGGQMTRMRAYTYTSGPPSISAIAPNTTGANGNVAVTISGANFAADTTVIFGGVGAAVTSATATSLTATVPPHVAGTVDVVAVNAGLDAGTATGAFTYTAAAPLPQITGLAPASVTEGSADFDLDVAGTNFTAGSSVTWNGSPRPTTVVGATNPTLRARIYGTDVAVAGQASVRVVNPDGGTSQPSTFTVAGCYRPCIRTSPMISAVSPTHVTAGGPDVTLTITGSNFTANTRVRWIRDGSSAERLTTLNPDGTLSVRIYGLDIATAGTAAVQAVEVPPGDGKASAPVPVTIDPCVRGCVAGPVISSLSPTSATLNGPAFTLTVNGTGFVSGATVSFGGVARATTVISAAQLTAPIAAADLATAGTAQVIVRNPDGSASAPATFTIQAPPPVLTTLSPTGATAGGPGFDLTITGTGFVPGATVQWQGQSRTPSAVSATQVVVPLTAADIVTAGVYTVTVTNPGSAASNALTFTVSNPVPVLTAIAPDTTAAAGLPFSLTVSGSGFVQASVVRWNGAARTTHYVSATQLTADITAADIAAPGTATVTVWSGTPGGGLSATQTFTITAPVPVILSAGPAMAVTGSAALTLTLDGTGFVAGASVHWNGLPRVTTYVSGTQIRAAIPAADLAAAADAIITVTNPDGSASQPAWFRVCGAANCPAIATLSQPTAQAGGTQGLTLTLSGANFSADAQVLWNGVARAPSGVAPTSLQLAVAAADLATPGVVTLQVIEPAQRNITSNTVEFRVCGAAGCPLLGALNPDAVVAYASPLPVVEIRGRGFAPNAVAYWNGAARPTQVVSATRLTVTLTAADVDPLTAPATAWVRVKNPESGGGAASPSNQMPFRLVGCGRSCPTITSLSPATAVAGSGGLTLTITGTNFAPGAMVRWNGALRVATVVSATQLTVVLTAADLVAAGAVPVAVENPDGSAAPPATFTVQ